MKYFEYGVKEIEYLKKMDKALGAIIDVIGVIKREITPDPFEALVESIISQQISGKAAATVCERLIGQVGSLSPIKIAAASLESIKACGMSLRKASYIKSIAEAAINGHIDFNTFDKLSDDEIISKLVQFKGVGVWTVEMLLIFSLCRKDVISYNDLAIKRGMMKLYELDELPREVFERYRKLYSPYASIASLYLWELSAK